MGIEVDNGSEMRVVKAKVFRTEIWETGFVCSHMAVALLVTCLCVWAVG